MIVWVLEWLDYNDTHVEGVYASRKAAKAAAQGKRKTPVRWRREPTTKFERAHLMGRWKNGRRQESWRLRPMEVLS